MKWAPCAKLVRIYYITRKPRPDKSWRPRMGTTVNFGCFLPQRSSYFGLGTSIRVQLGLLSWPVFIRYKLLPRTLREREYKCCWRFHYWRYTIRESLFILQIKQLWPYPNLIHLMLLNCMVACGQMSPVLVGTYRWNRFTVHNWRIYQSLFTLNISLENPGQTWCINIWFGFIMNIPAIRNS